MIFIARSLLCAAALLAAGNLAAQEPRCRHGRADESPMGVEATLPVHPTRVAPMLDAVLRGQGYEVVSSPTGVGTWDVAPRHTWLSLVENENWHGDEHPGVLVVLRTQPRGDSTVFVMRALALCRVPPPRAGADPVDRKVEITSVAYFAAGIAAALEVLRAEGIDLLTPLDRPRGPAQAPGAPRR